MKKLFWKVSDDLGNHLFSTATYDDTIGNRATVGKTLRKAFPSADGYSVKRCKVRD